MCREEHAVNVGRAMTEFLARLSGSFSASPAPAPAPAPRPTLPQLQARLEKVVERSEARAARTVQLYWLRKQLDAAVPDGALKPTQRLEARGTNIPRRNSFAAIPSAQFGATL